MKNFFFRNWKCFFVTLWLTAFSLYLYHIHFLLFHTTIELFSSIVAVSLFIISWNTYKFSQNQFIVFLGISFLFVGAIDLSHTIAYKGMNIIQTNDANEATQLWIGARVLESVSLLLAPIFIGKKIRFGITFSAMGTIFALLMVSIFAVPVFPDCYLPPNGLTSFKVISEYVICGILFLAVVHLFQIRHKLAPDTFWLMMFAIGFTIFSEMAFTQYANVYDFSNQLGHIAKLAALILFYRAVVEITLKNPYESMFQQLQQHKEEQATLIEELQSALQHIKQLQGFLPICSHCKQIRDDQGYWTQIEKYISDHAEVQFSHGICPQCLHDLYPEYATTISSKFPPTAAVENDDEH